MLKKNAEINVKQVINIRYLHIIIHMIKCILIGIEILFLVNLYKKNENSM